jgi:hypothetical protein
MESAAGAGTPPHVRSVSLRRGAGHVGRLALGLVFLLAGVLKALDPAEFAHQVAGYGIVGERLAAITAPALIVLELLLAIALIAGARPILGALASLLLLLFFMGIEAYGLANGRTESCGCFGSSVHRTPAEVIGEDLVFAGLALLAIWGLRDWAGLRPARATALLLLAAVLSTTVVIASPSLPVFDAVYDNLPFASPGLRAGRTMADLDLAARVPELRDGRHLVALLDVTDPGAAGVAAALAALAGAPGGAPVVGLTPSSEQEIDAFRWTAVPAFEIHRIDRDVVKRLYRRLPRFFLVDAGRVSAVFDGAPPEAKDLI